MCGEFTSMRGTILELSTPLLLPATFLLRQRSRNMQRMSTCMPPQSYFLGRVMSASLSFLLMHLFLYFSSSSLLLLLLLSSCVGDGERFDDWMRRLWIPLHDRTRGQPPLQGGVYGCLNIGSCRLTRCLH